MPCSTEFARSQIKAMAKAKTVAIAKLRLTPEQQADMIDFMAGESAKRFDGEIVARACQALSLEKKGWPEPSEFLDACAKAHNEHVKRFEGHLNREAAGPTLNDALVSAGFKATVLAGLGPDRWSPLFEIYRHINVATLRRIVNGIKSGRRLTVSDGEWRLTHDDDPTLTEVQALSRAGYRPQGVHP